MSLQMPPPHVGDEIQVERDVLVEVAQSRPGAPATWRYLPAGSRGKLIGWRDRRDDSRAVVDVSQDGVGKRLVVFVRDISVTAPRD